MDRMTDEQLDEIDQAMSDGAVTWYQLERLTAETRRLRELERAVDAIVYHVDSDAGRDRHWFIRERVSQEQSDAIGRLLEPSPTVADVIGIAPDMTGGMSSEAYVRQIRDTQEAERE